MSQQATFNDLSTAIQARLKSGLAALAQAPSHLDTDKVVVLVEDVADLETQLDKALSDHGMLVKIGNPVCVNEAPQNPAANMKIHLVISLGEEPTIWRDDAQLRPACKDMAQIVIRLLQLYPVAGYQRLRVLRADPVAGLKLQMYDIQIETLLLMQPLP